MIEDVLLRRDQTAHDLVAGLQDTLAIALERLSVAAPLARADSSAIRSFHAGGLPSFDAKPLRLENSPRRPWWSGLARPLAVWATERGIHDRLASTLTEVVSFHDRQLESWLKLKVARLVDLYEAQAGAFREQIRRAETTRRVLVSPRIAAAWKRISWNFVKPWPLAKPLPKRTTFFHGSNRDETWFEINCCFTKRHLEPGAHHRRTRVKYMPKSSSLGATRGISTA